MEPNPPDAAAAPGGTGLLPVPLAMEGREGPGAVRLAAVVAAPALMVALYTAHVDGANGPAYWRWPWQNLDLWRLAGPAALCALPFAAAQWLHAHRPGRVALPLGLVTASMLSLQVTLAAMQWQPASLERIWRIVASPDATSYLNEALRQEQNPSLLATWPEEMDRAVIHARNKPAGPVLYWRGLLALLGPRPGADFEAREAALIRVALTGGLLLALLGALAVPATHALLRALGLPAGAAFLGASTLAFMPGPVLFTPELDQAFPLLTAALLGTWAAALARDRLAWAATAGSALALLVFMTYVPLVLGVSVVGLAAVHLLRRPGWPGVGRVAAHAAVTLGAAAALLAILRVTTGYDAVAAFRAALASQAIQLEALGPMGLARPWPASIPFDLADFCLGAGWMVPALAVAWACRAWRRPDLSATAGAALGLLQPLVTAATGLLRGETARVWIFLLPLLAAPAGLELTGWGPRARAAAFAGAWIVLLVVAANLSFIQP